ncbi:hypothetical protein GPJ56_010835 [Histomonas meleagridis]|uniref:uncharacterized protein n=1 Tax=Histomonas meleagridis TaxID=135588 RepID=UPI00355937BA|nr:hypothetical protein GPJ56_010835 [Histomonas meleagridis]KAH0803743.1 hypothetical protein GO595_003517 [Histomonas meleagridis]
MNFADCSATSFFALNQAPHPSFSVPLLDGFLPNGPFHNPRIFHITGHPQSYKTTLAVEIASDFLAIKSSATNIVWLDCDYKFPFDLMKIKQIDMSRIIFAQCRSSEEILFNLLHIEHLLQYHDDDNQELIRAIFIDGFNSSFWIDEKTSEFTKSKRWVFKSMIEKFVSSYGVSVIVVFQDIGDFDIWQSFETAPFMKLRCSKTSPGEGILSYDVYSDKFQITENREFKWGKRLLNSDMNQQQEPEEEAGEPHM